MSDFSLDADISGLKVYFVGIKGTGMAALAELFHRQGAIVSGSDVEDVFYTDTILSDLGIPYYKGFAEEQLPEDADVVIYSAAYDVASHPELAKAQRLGRERKKDLLVYPEALGFLSQKQKSFSIAGVHGKTTTTALCGALVQGLGLKGSVLVGSGVNSFGNKSTYSGGNDFFIAETCEYRRHFMDFSPRKILLTSIEADHLDYFKDYHDIFSAFLDFAKKLPHRGGIVYCADDAGASDMVDTLLNERLDLHASAYGFSAYGDFEITRQWVEDGYNCFTLKGFSGMEFDGQDAETIFKLSIPGRHVVQDAAGAVALLCSHLKDQGINYKTMGQQIADALLLFKGTRRRSEIVGETEDAILFIDDYGHHPSAIKTTLQGYREFYSGRRLIVDFMSHTYSRTASLLDEFASSFGDADIVILHKIYASAREEYNGTISGIDLFRLTSDQHKNVMYYEEVEDAFDYANDLLMPGDVFITMGAGDNWKLGRQLYESRRK